MRPVVARSTDICQQLLSVKETTKTTLQNSIVCSIMIGNLQLNTDMLKTAWSY